jgi:phosphoribosylaminoimidazole carboxylase (NCAIR synthetase)
VTVHFLDGDPSPAAVAAHHAVGSFESADDIRAFVESNRLDVLTVEIEHINVDALETATAELGVDVQPTPATLRVIQDKYLQKQHFEAHGVAVADFCEVLSGADALRAGQEFGYPYMLKSKRLAYDGRGNAVVESEASLAGAVASVGGYEHGLYAERFAPFIMELAVMVARCEQAAGCDLHQSEKNRKNGRRGRGLSTDSVPPCIRSICAFLDAADPRRIVNDCTAAPGLRCRLTWTERHACVRHSPDARGVLHACICCQTRLVRRWPHHQ